MTTLDEKAKKKIKKREREIKRNRVLKKIRNIILLILSVIFVFIAVVFATNEIKCYNEKQLLTKEKLLNLVEVEDNRSINASLYGNPKSEYTIVSISGIGVQDYSVFMQHMMSKLKDDYRIVLIDRAGYGYSDDSLNKQTIEQIVSDYRTALENSNISKPYLLLAHEFGGVYATYWAAMYPDEIDGILYLDGTEMVESTTFNNENHNAIDYIESVMYKIGFQRMLYNKFYPHSSKALNKKEALCSRALNAKSVQTFAQMSELSLMKENFDKAMECLDEVQDIPKLYVSSKNSFSSDKDVIKYYEYKNVQQNEMGLEPFYQFTDNVEKVEKDAKEFITTCMKRYETITKPHVKKLGNCQLTKMPGDIRIYEHKPEGLVDVVIDFIAFLEGDEDAIQSYYDDSKMIDWADYYKDQMAEPETTEPTKEKKSTQ
jgi:hypothetical protein